MDDMNRNGPARGRAVRLLLRAGILAVLAASLAACDKCGNATPIYAPWHQGSCHGETIK